MKSNTAAGILSSFSDAQFWEFMSWAQRNERRFETFSAQIRAWAVFQFLISKVSMN